MHHLLSTSRECRFGRGACGAARRVVRPLARTRVDTSATVLGHTRSDTMAGGPAPLLAPAALGSFLWLPVPATCVLCVPQTRLPLHCPCSCAAIGDCLFAKGCAAIPQDTPAAVAAAAALEAAANKRQRQLASQWQAQPINPTRGPTAPTFVAYVDARLGMVQVSDPCFPSRGRAPRLHCASAVCVPHSISRLCMSAPSPSAHGAVFAPPAPRATCPPHASTATAPLRVCGMRRRSDGSKTRSHGNAPPKS